ncbi:unnamed protein product [Mytilus edulis]|uniref:Mitochondria-eating protein C-terminal domain-containing protein n=1 Tax=Mytilus edulis TaxID=6550 RepID=A0A8S3T8L1_MYTED|nr:unnamed protein product [Mytilus edulis]
MLDSVQRIQEKYKDGNTQQGNGRMANNIIATAKDNLKPLTRVYDSRVNNENEKLKAENTILKRKKANNRLSMEREKTILDVKKTSVDQTLKDENSRLNDKLNQLNIDNADLRKELDRARTSLSKIAGERMTDGNPYITDLSDPQRPQKLSEPYVNKCIELCWYSAISDPPLVYAFEANTNVDDFRGYTKSGDEIDYVVWPSMYLHEYGPLLYKGVVQYKMTDKHEDKPEPQKTVEDDATDKTDVLQEKTEDHATDKKDSKPELQEQTADQMAEKLDGKPKLQEKPDDHMEGKTDVKLEPQEKTENRETDKTDDKPELQEKAEENAEKKE